QSSLFTGLPIGQNPSTNPNATGTPSGGGGGGGANCTAIPESQLVTVDSYKLLAETATRYKAMKAAAAKDGVALIITSGYRSPADQEAAWNQNGCRLVNGKAVCSTRTAAVPCSLGGNGSNHTRGTAVDIRLNAGVYDWLARNASRFGFYNKLSNDLPHWSDTGR
ncbi:MAG: M15 family metallopeptidase, partial [Patescibacteria group bacterium]